MSTATTASALVQVGGGLVLAPVLPGRVQHWKARLKGRRGPSPRQPYRELRRLWAKSSVEVEGASAAYQLAPALVGAAVAAAVLLVPVAQKAPNLGVGHDALARGCATNSRTTPDARGTAGQLRRTNDGAAAAANTSSRDSR